MGKFEKYSSFIVKKLNKDIKCTIGKIFLIEKQTDKLLVHFLFEANNQDKTGENVVFYDKKYFYTTCMIDLCYTKWANW